MNNNYDKIKNRFINYIIYDKPLNLYKLIYTYLFNPKIFYKQEHKLIDKLTKHLIKKEIKSKIKNFDDEYIYESFLKLFKSKDELEKYINKYFNKFEQTRILMNYHKLYLEVIYNDIIFILNNDIKTNKEITIYYKLSNKLVGYIDDHIKNKKDYLYIKTNKYIKINDIYFILNYNTEDYILNWNGLIDSKHTMTYHALRLYRLNNKLYKEIYKDVKTLNNNDFNKKYNNNHIAKSIYDMNRKNIKIKDEYNNLINYINKNNKQYKLLYRGEARDDKVNYIKHQIIEYKNIHPFTKDNKWALMFMNGGTFFNSTAKDYILYILKNGYAAEIHPIVNIDAICIYDYYEYLHKPTKYKIMDIKVINKKFYFKYEKKYHTINYYIIVLQEV